VRRQRADDAVAHRVDVEQRQRRADGVVARQRERVGEEAPEAQEVAVTQGAELRPAGRARGVDVGGDLFGAAIEPAARGGAAPAVAARHLDLAAPRGLHVDLDLVTPAERARVAPDPQHAARHEVVEHRRQQLVGVGRVDQRGLQPGELGRHPRDEVRAAVVADHRDDVAAHQAGLPELLGDRSRTRDDTAQAVGLPEGTEGGVRDGRSGARDQFSDVVHLRPLSDSSLRIWLAM
jgi:hypothetical protein